MLHHIPNVLSKEQVQYFREEMNKIEWVNGKVTAGTLSATVKQNQQLPEDHPLTHHLSHIILESLGQHPLFLSAAIPLDIIPLCSTVMKITKLLAFMSTTPFAVFVARMNVSEPTYPVRFFE